MLTCQHLCTEFRSSYCPGMKHTNLGRTGLKVTKLCLGTMTFGLQCDEATSASILDTAFDAGITFLDTADVYPSAAGSTLPAAPRRSSAGG